MIFAWPWSDESWMLHLQGPLLAGGWQGMTLAVVGLVVPLLFIAWQIRLTAKLTGTRQTWWLLVPRAVLVIFVWSLLALEPMWVQVRTQNRASVVVVAVDLSSSMNFADRQRTQIEKLRLAKTLNLGDRAEIEQALQALETVPAVEFASKVAESISRIDKLSRRDVVKKLLSTSGLNLLERLSEQHRVEIVGFHRDLVEGLSLDALDEALPEDRETDVGVPLRFARNPAGLGKTVPLGVVLLSDGQHNFGPRPLSVARELGERGVPIYAVGIGSKVPPRDVAVLEVLAPSQIAKDAEMPVEARVRLQGLPAGMIDVELVNVGPPRKRLETKTINHSGRDGAEIVRFTTKLSEVGPHRLEVKATPRDSGMDEVSLANNQLTARVRVSEDKVRVLMVDDEVGWESYYLAAALGRDRDVKLERIVFDPPRLGAIADDKREAANLPGLIWPKLEPEKDDPLWAYDCIILGSLSAKQVPLAIQERLDKYVAEREGTLVLIGNPRRLANEELDDPFAKLRPIEQLRPFRPKEGFRLELTDVGTALAFTNLGEALQPGNDPWRELPPQMSGLVGRARPGAQILARAKSFTPAKTNAEKDEQDAFMVLGNIGLGRVLWIGVDGTWRWRYRVGDRDHHRFWGQLVRWSASEIGPSDGRKLAIFGTRKPAYVAGQAAEAFLQLGAKAPILNPQSVKLKILRVGEDGSEKPASSAVLRAMPDRPRLWEAKLPVLPAGDYRLTLDVPELAGLVPVEKTGGSRDRFTIAQPERGELADFAVNWDLLRALSEQSGGRLFSADEADQLPNLLARRVSHEEERLEQRPWRDTPWVWWIMGIVVGLLTADWVARKMAGLPS